MGFRINTNIAAMNSHRNAVNTNIGLDKSLNSLSSGLRINKAADDASGMTIADSLRSQAQGLGQAINNANDGVAVIQTADGALDEYINIINTVRTKSIQAASDGQNADSRAAIQADIDRLLEAANGIAKTTQFNGQQLLDGTFSNKAFHIGAYAGETVNLSVDNTQTDSVGDIKGYTGGSTHTALVTGTNVNEDANGYALNSNQLKINDIDVSGSINTLSPTKLTDAASVAAAITDATGLVANASNTLTAGGAITAGSISSTNELKINGIAIADTDVLADDSSGALVRAINDISDQTGVTAALNSTNKLELTSVDGSNISVTTQSTAVAQVDTLSISAVTTGAITGDTFTWSNGTSTATYTATGAETQQDIIDGLAAAINGLSNMTATSSGADITITGNTDGTAFTGDTSVLGTGTSTETYSAEDTVGLTITEISQAVTGLSADNLTDQTGSAVTRLVSTVTSATVIAAGELIINGVDLAGTYGDGSTADSARDELENAIQDITGLEDSSIAAATGAITLIANNGDDLNISGSNANTLFKLTKGVENESKIGSVEIYSNSALQIGGDDVASFGFTSGTKAVSELGVSLEDVNVTNRNSAEIAILITDSALKQLDATRADLGSVQNQLESTIRNISVTQVNVTAAESQIRDVDFAAESANFAKLNILAQSGSYAMSQANAVQQNVMRLLQ